MNLTSQYVVNPNSKKAYSNSNATYQSIQSSHSKIRLNKNRERLIPDRKNHIFFRVSDIIFKMIVCQKGDFTMGSDIKEDSNPKRLVSIDRSFLLGETEVTQEIFKKVMGFNPSKFQGKKYPNSKKRPVEMVTWYDALMFCNKLSEICKKKLYYNIVGIKYGEGKDAKNIIDAIVTINPQANGFRLPLEKEWEYAAKARTNNQFAGTNDPNELGEVAWFDGNSKFYIEQETHPVKGKRPNEWGFYDMSGNVSKWCWDKWDKYSDYRVHRGGSYGHHAEYLRSACRTYDPPNFRFHYLGFRVSASLFN
jgi:formylglycine-generating enzyme required for sulfatase activity